MPELVADGRTLEYAEVGRGGEPPLLFLHEGLGSIELWRSFPADVAAATGRRGVAYSRYGHGMSDPLSEPRVPSFMHDEALVVLPEVRAALGLERPVLVGHSDGASISIIHAGAGYEVAALVLIAPHVFVEEASMGGIDAAWERYDTTDLAERMARYHRDPHATFRGWGEIWRSEEFRSWNIEEYLPSIECPVLVVQGSSDEYGTEAQVDAIVGQLPGPVESVLIEGCGHSPHLEAGERVVAATVDFIRRTARY